MKLLLSSDGLTNDAIAKALEKLTNKPRSDTRIGFIPTAAFSPVYKPEDSKKWLVEAFERVIGYSELLDIVSLADLPTKSIVDRLNYADVIFVGGGDAFYLSYWMQKHQLFEKLPALLQDKVYAGISAGSIIATPTLATATAAMKDPQSFQNDDFNRLGAAGYAAGVTAGLVDFAVRPHLDNPSFSHITPESLKILAAHVAIPLYVLDDDSAVSVNGSDIEIVSEGKWELLGG